MNPSENKQINFLLQIGLVKGTIENFVRSTSTNDIALCEYGANLAEEGILSEEANEISKIMQEVIVYMRMKNEDISLRIEAMEAKVNEEAEKMA